MWYVRTTPRGTVCHISMSCSPTTGNNLSRWAQGFNWFCYLMISRWCVEGGWLQTDFLPFYEVKLMQIEQIGKLKTLVYNELSWVTYHSTQVSAQVLMVILDHESASMQSIDEKSTPTNYFTYFLSRIHREEDFHFILCGLIKLLNNPLLQVWNLFDTIWMYSV